MTEIGPVQLIALAFDPEAKFEGRILDELAKLEQERTIRILDLLFVHKDLQTGQLVALDHQGESLGGIVGALLGFEFEGIEEKVGGAGAGDHAFGMTDADINGVAESL